ncbi:hypothetical protein E2C01_006478 [Portunus trituberculatus]|uniref:Uncharacterized protein n=1 Tax=Portunus trituberculatus TaxID=210409 RepID=A0A5B7D1Y0_PORTR|nr:hypothetical protein [Portunus trituberculatus]
MALRSAPRSASRRLVRAAASQVGGGTEAAVFKWVTRKGCGGIWSRCVAGPGARRLLRSFCGGDQLDISCGLRGPFPILVLHPSCRWSAAETRHEEADHLSHGLGRSHRLRASQPWPLLISVPHRALVSLLECQAALRAWVRPAPVHPSWRQNSSIE